MLRFHQTTHLNLFKKILLRIFFDTKNVLTLKMETLQKTQTDKLPKVVIVESKIDLKFPDTNGFGGANNIDTDY